MRRKNKPALSAEERLMLDMLANDAGNGDEPSEWSDSDGMDDRDDDHDFRQVAFADLNNELPEVA